MMGTNDYWLTGDKWKEGMYFLVNEITFCKET